MNCDIVYRLLTTHIGGWKGGGGALYNSSLYAVCETVLLYTLRLRTGAAPHNEYLLIVRILQKGGNARHKHRQAFI